MEHLSGASPKYQIGLAKGKALCHQKKTFATLTVVVNGI